jgi:glycosyltransferase involved in cell wall biosynthesis
MFNFITPINDRSYGLVGINLAHNLVKNGCTPALFPLNPESASCSPRYADSVKKAFESATFFNPDLPCVRLWHQFDMRQFVGRGPKIGFTIFELDKFNDIEKHNLKWLDRLIVCSEWAKNIVETEVPTLKGKIGVVPLSADYDIFQRRSPPKNKLFRFFNAGKCEIRKGHDILCDLFNKAFEPTDDVELYISWHNPFYTPEEMAQWMGFYLSSKMGKAGKIKFAPWFKTQEELAEFMKTVDCGIFPSRAEGWNLELAECIAMGIPVITTNYSAHTEFCHKGNANLVEIKETELAYDGKWFNGTGNWAYIGSNEQAAFIDYLRHHYYSRINVNNGSLKYSWLDSSKIFLNNVNQA